MAYKIDLDIYSGPMDLLLYLVRREEVDIRDLPIARIADQYIAYLEQLRALDIELAGEFVVMAATLLELKSRALLPRPPAPEDEASEDEGEDPRETLIRQLIEYRRYKGAASHLDRLQRDMARRHPRRFDDRLLEALRQTAEEVPPEDLLEGVAVWDLVSAFSRVMRTLGYARPREVVYDETPVEDAAADLLERLEREKSLRFVDLFAGGRRLDYCIAMFLAVLELVRQRRIGVEQRTDFADMRLYLRDPASEPPPVQRRPRGAAASAEAIRRKRPRRPGRRSIYDDLSEAAELEKTEFDEILDAIQVPEIDTQGPFFTEEEVLGRPPPEAEPSAAPGPRAEPPSGGEPPSTSGAAAAGTGAEAAAPPDASHTSPDGPNSQNASADADDPPAPCERPAGADAPGSPSASGP